MKTDYSNWTQNEFRVYVLLYAAYSDHQLQEEEKELILSRTTESQYRHIHKAFTEANDYERLQTIQGCHKWFCSSEEEVEKLIREIIGILYADKTLTRGEDYFYKLFHRILL